MSHPRELIRHAVVALLVAANTNAGTRVKATRVEPNKKSGLPAISVYTLNDPVDPEASSEMEEVHQLELEITLWVAHSEATPVDDAMDSLADQVKTAMLDDPYLGGLANDVQLRGSVMQVVEDDGRSDPLVGVNTLTYAVAYSVALEST